LTEARDDKATVKRVSFMYSRVLAAEEKTTLTAAAAWWDYYFEANGPSFLN